MAPKRSALRRPTNENTSRPVVRAARPKRNSFTATEAKNEFGRLLERAIQGETVVITKHDTPKAVLISVDEYNARSPQVELATLTAEFNAMFERMQNPKARAAMDKAFHLSSEELGKAAVAAAKKRA